MKKKVAVVTGAGSGIGKATADKFTEEGFQVVLADVSETRGKEVEAQLKEKGREVLFVKTDVSSYDQVQHLIEKTVDTYGTIDVMFNNAGIGDMGSILDPDLDMYQKTIEVNQHGVAYGIFAAARKMVALNVQGVIINTASVFGYMASRGTFAYQASKGAVRMMTQTAALELGEHGIRVVGIAPGGVDTPIIQGYKDMGALESLKRKHLRNELIQPEEIAGVAYLLTSPDAQAVNGSVVMADDGYASFR
ncbi:SDR family NAD(P)-dependent oxidoreductase [Salimicrobium halophilum]|uniref:NAD(P)-dependent dehydrogenase, short-chain alcohol dehydrogenase family n=1 Tax=Salimicrobium halophilum TaxID=86666 RepID=A0A1G8WPW7_9BACI|nr:SDR family oxidoreductase [Salimicrobium halophilum]SDJ80344.1 NAD(P)-dependent dehydrogenase, short-chain alcohol dehydrogenase family [Salimicrobium halophilum]